MPRTTYYRFTSETNPLDRVRPSKAGLSKVIKNLMEYRLIEEAIIGRCVWKREAYKATVNSLRDAEAKAILHEFLEDLDEITGEQEITRRDAEEAMEILLEYPHYMALLIIMEILEGKTSSTAKKYSTR